MTGVPTGAPALETARLRLRLRAWQPSDLEPYAAIQADPAVRHYLGNGLPLTIQEAEANLTAFIEQWAVLGHGHWAVDERSSGALLGWCGFLRWSEGTSDEAPELGYGYGKAAWGRGYATEAARAALTWGFATFAWPSVVALTHPENAASQRVLAKVGFLPAGDAHGPFYAMKLFRASRADFEATRAAAD